MTNFLVHKKNALCSTYCISQLEYALDTIFEHIFERHALLKQIPFWNCFGNMFLKNQKDMNNFIPWNNLKSDNLIYVK